MVMGENGPPVGLPYYRGIPTIKRPISTEIDKLSGIFFGKQIAPALAQSCTLLAFSPEGAIYRLEPSARVLGDAETRRVPGSRQTQP